MSEYDGGNYALLLGLRYDIVNLALYYPGHDRHSTNDDSVGILAEFRVGRGRVER